MDIGPLERFSALTLWKPYICHTLNSYPCRIALRKVSREVPPYPFCGYRTDNHLTIHILPWSPTRQPLKLKGVDWEVLEKADHKILLNRLAVKKKIFSNILGNFTHIGDCRMKCCMKGQKVKNEISGSYPRPDSLKCLKNRQSISQQVSGT